MPDPDSRGMNLPMRSTRPDAAAPRLGRLAVLAAFTLLCVLALAGAAPARAQLSPLGGQFQVNSYTTGIQYHQIGRASCRERV